MSDCSKSKQCVMKECIQTWVTDDQDGGLCSDFMMIGRYMSYIQTFI